MGKVTKITLSLLRNDESYTLHSSLSELAAGLSNEMAKAKASDYAAAFGSLKAAIDRQPDDSVAKKAKDADTERDNAWSGANAVIKAVAAYGYDAAQKAAAEPIASLFEKYGNPTGLTYAEETSVIENLVESVQSLGEDTIKAAGFDGWLLNLKAKQESYKEAAKASVDSAAAKVLGEVKSARSACDTAWAELAKISEVLSMMGDAGVDDFISKANVIIEKQKQTTKGRSAKSEKSGELRVES